MALLLPSFPCGEKLHWGEAQQHSLPSGVFGHWLISTDSLTQRLKSLNKPFRVELLGERRIPFPRLEMMGFAEQDYWLREVVLYIDDQPWVFARTLIPEAIFNITQLGFGELGQKPLGELLYGSQSFEHGQLQFCQVPQHSEIQKISGCTRLLWGRRRPFSCEYGTLHVAEIFLPAAMDFLQQDKLSA
ncbi:chorismate lyase [Paraferrimonas sp. SM1919]|uniref:chorismate--pyruvate lyase family protein n=1 Tax=Paraferrimonas sp. SM1919 TaxID=2662263 RepID=UPI0013D48026|nr:chorismate lyase [Paraferrimonas sp. SM1919]